MTGTLSLITLLAYFLGAWTFYVAVDGKGGGSDIQIILSGIFFTCGTVAFAAIAVVNQLNKLEQRLAEKGQGK